MFNGSYWGFSKGSYMDFHGQGKWNSCRCDFGEFEFWDSTDSRIGAAKPYTKNGQKILIFNYRVKDEQVTVEKDGNKINMFNYRDKQMTFKKIK